MKERINRVKGITVALVGANMLRIHASGETNMAGWKDLELRSIEGAGDALTFEFVGEKPQTSAGVLTPVEASADYPLMPIVPKVVTVVASENDLTVSMKERVAEVTAVRAGIENQTLHVFAKGRTAQGGWGYPELRPIGHDVAELELVAIPGIGITIPADIEASGDFGPLLLPFPEEVTVHAATNAKTARVGRDLLYRITAVAASCKEGNSLEVHVKGEAATPGWTELELVFTGESEETMHFELIGKPPSDPVIHIITPFEATFERPLEPPFPRSVTVASATNEEGAEIEYASEKERVYQITSVTVRWESNFIHVAATASTHTLLCKFPELRLLPSSDAFELEFVGVPAGPPMFGEATAETTIGPLMPPHPDKLRVLGTTNSIEVDLTPLVSVGPKELVYAVTAVKASREATILNVYAKGLTDTNGWSDLELSYVDRVGDTARYAFTGRRPVGANPVMTPVEGFAHDLQRPPFPACVTVVAANGTAITVLVQEAIAITAKPSKKPAPAPRPRA